MRRVAVPIVFVVALLFLGAPPVGAETPALPVVRVSGTRRGPHGDVRRG